MTAVQEATTNVPVPPAADASRSREVTAPADKLPTADILVGLGNLTVDYQKVVGYGQEAQKFLNEKRQVRNAALEEFARLCVLADEAEDRFMTFFQQLETEPFKQLEDEPTAEQESLSFYGTLLKFSKEITTVHKDQLAVRMNFQTARTELRPATKADKAADANYKEKSAESETATTIRTKAEAKYDAEQEANKQTLQDVLAARRRAISNQGEMEEYYGRVNNQEAAEPVSEETTKQRTDAIEADELAKQSAEASLLKLSEARAYLLTITDMYVDSEENMQNYDETIPKLQAKAEVLLAACEVYVEAINDLHADLVKASREADAFGVQLFFENLRRREAGELRSSQAIPQLMSVAQSTAAGNPPRPAVSLNKESTTHVPAALPEVSHDTWQIADLDDANGGGE